MSRDARKAHNSESFRYAVDIGSTVIKIATVGNDGILLDQEFHKRDFDADIVDHLDTILTPYANTIDDRNLVICSSANGGLRVGIVCLSGSYSGSIYRNQVLLAGANPVFVQETSAMEAVSQFVDILLVGGGIDTPDTTAMHSLISTFSSSQYHYRTLVFAGNSFLARKFSSKFPDAKIIENPMAGGLLHPNKSIVVALRNAYLDDLVYKHGVTEVAEKYGCAIRPTPEIVSTGYYRATSERLFSDLSGVSVLMDIGGATTDFHYAVELVRDDSEDRPPAGSSVARYVFTDLGVHASLDSSVLQLRRNPRTYDFLDATLHSDVSNIYRQLREGEYTPSAELLGYACIFLGLDRFSRGDGPGLPTADLSKLNKLVLTGGAAQALDEDTVARIVSLFLPSEIDNRYVMIDRKYEIWVLGAMSN